MPTLGGYHLGRWFQMEPLLLRLSRLHSRQHCTALSLSKLGIFMRPAEPACKPQLGLLAVPFPPRGGEDHGTLI